VKNRRISDKSKKLQARRKSVLNRYNRFNFRDFSVIEDDSHAFKLIHRLANKAGIYAAAEARARGLGTTYVKNDKLVKVSAKGEAVTIIPKLNRVSFYVKYKPATILHAIQK
jgi:hypothetical protein